MSIPSSVDLDRLIRTVLEELATATSGWMAGQPRDEVAFMNHVTGRLSRRRRGCDVGNVSPVTLSTELAVLHRKGPMQTDLYGADLALTVSIPSDGFLKTCFLQFKRSDDRYGVQLEWSQVDAATSESGIEPRSFVTVVNEVRGGIRLKAVTAVKKMWPDGQKTRRVNASGWDGVAAWLHKWLQCSVGLRSNPSDPDGVEALLEVYRFRKEIDRDAIQAELGDSFIPARSWLQIELVLGEPAS